MIEAGRRGLVIIFFLAVSFSSIAQTSDTTEVRRIMQIVTALRENHPDSAYQWIEKGLSLANAIGDQPGIINLTIARGAYHWTKNNYIPAIEDYNNALLLSRKIKLQFGIHRSQINLGQVYSKLGDYPTAIDYFLKGIALGDSAHIDNSGAYNSLAIVYRKSNNLEEAISALEEATRLVNKSANKGTGISGGIYTTLGNIYLTKGDPARAMEFQQKALHVFDSLHQTRGMVVCYNNISEILIYEKKYNEALTWSEKSLAQCRKSNLFFSEALALEGIATIASNTGDMSKSITYLTMAIKLSEAHQHNTELIRLYYSLADNYEKLGDSKQALRYLRKHIVAKDSVFSQDANNKMTNLRIGFEMNKREVAVKLFEQEREIAVLNRNILIGLVSALLIILLLLGFYQYLRVKKNKMLVQQIEVIHRTKQQLLEAEVENEKLKQQELHWEIERKSKELTTHALNLLQKNEILEEIKEGLVGINADIAPDRKKDIQKLVSSITLSHHQDKEWDAFKIHFEKIHGGFFERLQREYPDLSGNDIKVCSLVKLNLGSKETASILGISMESVRTARYRLRKKLRLEQGQNLVSFLSAF